MTPHAVYSCDRCGQVLLIVMDSTDPGLPAELADKVDGHRCPQCAEGTLPHDH